MTQKLKILFVEDNELQQVLVSKLIAKESVDIELILAQTLAQATDLVESVDAVILDLGLPDASYDDVFEWLRQCEKPVVVYTASDDRKTIEEAIQSGALNVITKGTPGSQLITALWVAIAEHELLLEDILRRERLRCVLHKSFSHWLQQYGDQSESVLD